MASVASSKATAVAAVVALPAEMEVEHTRSATDD